MTLQNFQKENWAIAGVRVNGGGRTRERRVCKKVNCNDKL